MVRIFIAHSSKDECLINRSIDEATQLVKAVNISLANTTMAVNYSENTSNPNHLNSWQGWVKVHTSVTGVRYFR